MKLTEEIQEIKQQIKHFEEAFSGLKNPSSQPQGNQIAQVLQARFERLDSEEERQRSLESARTLLSEAKQKLSKKEQDLKNIAREIKEKKYKLDGYACRINQLSLKLQAEIEAMERELRSVNHRDWEMVYEHKLLNHFDNETILPFLEPLYGSCYKLEFWSPSSGMPQKSLYFSNNGRLSFK